MDTEKVMQDLNRRFAAPLMEYYKRRIIFWYDEDREFEDKLDEVTLNNATLIRLTGTNAFAVKKRIHDDPLSNFLVYMPYVHASQENDWLLDVQLYSEEFRADLISIWMDEMHIPSTPRLREMVKKYRKFFNSKERRAKIAALDTTITAPSQLHLGVMAVICGVKKLQTNAILHAVLKAELNGNDLYMDIESYGAQEAFWALCAQLTGYNAEEPTVHGVMVHILMTAATRSINVEYLMGLERFYASSRQAWCYDFVSDWLHSDEKGLLHEAALQVEDELKLYDRFRKMPVEDRLENELFPGMDESILEQLMREIGDQNIRVELIRRTVEKRRTCVWYPDYALYYEGLLQVAQMMAFYKEHADGFHTVEPHKLWQQYTAELYQMDSYYRQFHMVYAERIREYHSFLNDLFKLVADEVEGLYTRWFLPELSRAWTNASEEELREYGYIHEIGQQTSFYVNHVKSNNAKTYVIISDALRYEVAASLAEQLRQEMQGKVELNSIQAVFPTVTKYGMAALLPHTQLTLTEDATYVLADGASTESGHRDAILKRAKATSVALQYKHIIGMKRSERSALVKGMDVVYIYHDAIDSASHTSDALVFGACEDAIAEIKNLVKIIVNDFGSTNILITADHGFLYTYSPLTEADKVGKTDFINHAIEYDKRYAIMQPEVLPQYLLPVRLLSGRTPYTAYTPRETVRIRKSGGGQNFVHGGATLQEMVVPVISYHHLRNASKAYQQNKDKYDTKPVALSLLSANHKICNMIFGLNFVQAEAVGDNRIPCNYLIYLVDDQGKQVSDIQKVIADKVSENIQERTFRCTFHLKPLQYSNTKLYYLVIASEDGLQVPQKIEFQIDIAFTVDEFDFF